MAAEEATLVQVESSCFHSSHECPFHCPAAAAAAAADACNVHTECNWVPQNMLFNVLLIEARSGGFILLWWDFAQCAVMHK